ncbi:MAG: class I SAM-dependent methyltransferase, partial [Malacoplasma sp.]|nr:class I SAM-dependent methyltransferase [Malacoplasma sp.]
MRIREIANLINNTKIVVDVGSDHAQLSIFLISENRANLVYNIEKNDKPFLNSVNNTKKYKDKIINLKSDGFEKFDKSIEIDYCTISGMGSKTMIEILCKCINKIKNIIVCPNNNEYLIRKFAYDNFYKIKKDFFIRENEIFYPIIWLSKSEGIKQKNFKKNLLCGEKKVKKDDLLYPL